jgi:hypothetical protein
LGQQTLSSSDDETGVRCAWCVVTESHRIKSFKILRVFGNECFCLG